MFSSLPALCNQSGSDHPNQTLVAEALAADPRVIQAQRLMAEALLEAGQTLTGPRPADPARQPAYQTQLDRFAQQRGGRLFFPYLGSGAGRGPLVELADGSVKYDMITGIGVHYLGHAHPGLLEAVAAAAFNDTVMAGNLQQNTDSAELVDRLLALANRRPSGLAHCFLTSSGAMANENALKLAFQKHHPAARLLAFERCFCGRTLLLSQMTDKPAFRQGLPTPVAVDYVPGFDASDPAASLPRSLRVLRSHLSRYPGQHAAMKLELVQGEGGFYPGTQAYFHALIACLKEAGVAVVVDEIQTFGRTHEPFAFQHFGLEGMVDIVTIGKAAQVCATLFTEAYQPRPGLLSQTFTSSASAISAARYIIEQMHAGDWYGQNGRIAQVHARFVEHFDRLSTESPDVVSGPYGIGGMIALTAFGGDPVKTRALVDRLFELGVIAFTAGSSPTRLRMLPPVPVLEDGDIDAVCGILRTALRDIHARGD